MLEHGLAKVFLNAAHCALSALSFNLHYYLPIFLCLEVYLTSDPWSLVAEGQKASTWNTKQRDVKRRIGVIPHFVVSSTVSLGQTHPIKHKNQYMVQRQKNRSYKGRFTWGVSGLSLLPVWLFLCFEFFFFYNGIMQCIFRPWIQYLPLIYLYAVSTTETELRGTVVERVEEQLQLCNAFYN